MTTDLLNLNIPASAPDAKEWKLLPTNKQEPILEHLTNFLMDDTDTQGRIAVSEDQLKQLYLSYSSEKKNEDRLLFYSGQFEERDPTNNETYRFHLWEFRSLFGIINLRIANKRTLVPRSSLSWEDSRGDVWYLVMGANEKE